YTIPVFNLHPFEIFGLDIHCRSGVVDQHIQPGKLLFCGCDHRAYATVVADIAAIKQSPRAQRFGIASRSLGRVLAAAEIDDDVVTVLGQCQRCASTDSGGSTRNQSYRFFTTHRLPPIPLGILFRSNKESEARTLSIQL